MEGGEEEGIILRSSGVYLTLFDFFFPTLDNPAFYFSLISFAVFLRILGFQHIFQVVVLYEASIYYLHKVYSHQSGKESSMNNIISDFLSMGSSTNIRCTGSWISVEQTSFLCVSFLSKERR